ncbi:MAG: 4-hydroxy-tetrahydrodipicolinate synthase [Chitinivibrionales bacterium]|nr:4-hydroxy-tetrahydrodipicolinate synthase [Chitinivibrionales bacterium]
MELRGCYTAIVTPFAPGGEIDEEGIRRNLAFLIERGVTGVVPCGTTGESATLSWKEHHRVVEIVLEYSRGKLQVIAGAGSNNTAEAIAGARYAKKCGAETILCITPYYNRPTQEGLYQHYRQIATAVDVDVVVYNVPGRTGVNITPETLERLCEFSHIVGVKEASGNLIQISEIHRRLGDRLTILSGDDALTLPILACGGSGVVSVTANIWPEKVVAMIAAFQRHDSAAALALHEELLPVSNALFLETSPIPVKTAMNHLGLAAGDLRLPLCAMSEGHKQTLLAVLARKGISKVS